MDRTKQNAKDIMPEVFTPENKDKQIKLSRAYEGVLRRRVSLSEKKSILQRIKNGESQYSIWKKEYQNIYSSTGFKNMVDAISLDEELKLDGTELDPLPF